METKIVHIKNSKNLKKAIVIVSFLLTYSAYSQDKKIFIINPGQKVSDVILPADMYGFTEFQPGTVFFKDGSESSAPMNYNLMLNEVQFITGKGDTLSLADEKLIKFVKINNDSFFYNKGCYKLINSFSYIKLAKKEIIYMASASKIGAYNQQVQGGSASTYTNFSSGGRDVNLIVNEKITLKKEVSYYFEDQDGNIMPASRRNLEKICPKYSSAIEEYIKKKATDFKNGKDVENIFEHVKYLKL